MLTIIIVSVVIFMFTSCARNYTYKQHVQITRWLYAMQNLRNFTDWLSMIERIEFTDEYEFKCERGVSNFNRLCAYQLRAIFKTIIVNFAGFFLHWMDESECMNCRAVLGMFLAFHRCTTCRGWFETGLKRQYNTSTPKNRVFSFHFHYYCIDLSQLLSWAPGYNSRAHHPRKTFLILFGGGMPIRGSIFGGF